MDESEYFKAKENRKHFKLWKHNHLSELRKRYHDLIYSHHISDRHHLLNWHEFVWEVYRDEGFKV